MDLGPNLPSRLIGEMFLKVRDCPEDQSVAAVMFARFGGSHSTSSLTSEENLQPINMC